MCPKKVQIILTRVVVPERVIPYKRPSTGRIIRRKRLPKKPLPINVKNDDVEAPKKPMWKIHSKK
jgi:hypothetical protein